MGDLTTLQAARSWLGQTSDVDDVNLQRAISATSAQIESFCSRKFTATDYVERYDGNGKSTLTLKHYPIISVSALSVNGYAFAAGNLAASFPTGYLIRPPRSLVLATQFFENGFQNVLVSYRAGFEPGTIPADLELCCLEWLKAGYLNRTTDTSSSAASSSTSRGPVIEEQAGGSKRKYATPDQLAAAQSVTGTSFATSVPAPKTIVAALLSYKDVVPL
jgi:hypothetical protein